MAMLIEQHLLIRYTVVGTRQVLAWVIMLI